MGDAVRRGAGIHNRNISDGAGVESHKFDFTYQNADAFLDAKSARGFYPAVPEIGDFFYSLDEGGLFVGDEVGVGDVQFVPIGGEDGSTIYTVDAQISQARIFTLASNPFLLYTGPDNHIIEFIGGRMTYFHGGTDWTGPPNNAINFEVKPTVAPLAPATDPYSVSTAIPDSAFYAPHTMQAYSVPESETSLSSLSPTLSGENMYLQVRSLFDMAGGSSLSWSVRAFYRLINEFNV